MLLNIRKARQTLWQLLYQGDMPYFVNLEPIFLDLITYLNYMSMIMILHPPLLFVNIGRKEGSIFRRGTCLEKENFV